MLTPKMRKGDPVLHWMTSTVLIMERILWVGMAWAAITLLFMWLDNSA